MKRRSFLSVFTGAIAAAAVSARLIREEPKPEVVEVPTGSFRCIEVGRYGLNDDGHPVRIYPYIRQGDFAVPNPAYESAPWQDVLYVHGSGDAQKNVRWMHHRI